MHPRYLSIHDYSYELPADRIAAFPLAQRDDSKLLVFQNKKIAESNFRKLADWIPEGSLMVFNNTRVLEARLLFKKPSGGTIEIFALEPPGTFTDIHSALQQTGEVEWKCLVGGASKWKHGFVPEKRMQTEKGEIILRAEIRDRLSDTFLIRFTWTPAHLTFPEVLHEAGQTPLPPYLKREVDRQDAERYQTVYAKEEGSVAAPTAGLHFTRGVLESLKEKNIDSAWLTLHVGAGTFKPVKADQLSGHDMHSEFIEVDRDTLQKLAENRMPVYAVGTTSLRTLESLYWMGVKTLINPDITAEELPVTQWEVYDNVMPQDIPAAEALTSLLKWLTERKENRLISHTQILIAPGYSVRMIKGLITNFHQPQSTLLLLIAALVGDSWKDIYTYALDHGFRFLSYGDGSLLEV